MRRHVALIAEQAFWDSVEQGLGGHGRQDDSGSGGPGPTAPITPTERVAALLAELGEEVVAVLPEQGEGAALAEEIRQCFSLQTLTEALGGGAIYHFPSPPPPLPSTFLFLSSVLLLYPFPDPSSC